MVLIPSSLVFFFEDSIPTSACFCSENFFVTFYIQNSKLYRIAENFVSCNISHTRSFKMQKIKLHKHIHMKNILDKLSNSNITCATMNSRVQDGHSCIGRYLQHLNGLPNVVQANYSSRRSMHGL